MELAGNLTLPAEKNQPAKSLPLTGKSSIDYHERLLAVTQDGDVARTLRSYDRLQFERKIGAQIQQSSLRGEVRRLVLLRHNHVEVPFALSGPLTMAEIDLVRTDVFTPALAGLLPDRAVQHGDKWQVAVSAVHELTDLERIETGGLTCTLDSIMTIAGRRHARVTFLGTIEGIGEDGRARHQLDGYFFFDLEGNYLSYLTLRGLQMPLGADGNPLGRIEGTFVLTRNPLETNQSPDHAGADLSDESLRGLILEPNEENTLLLYENPELGVRFLYPRRWRVVVASGRQVALDAAGGNGILMTVEPLQRVPTAAQYLTESRTFLTGQKASILKIEPAQVLSPLSLSQAMPAGRGTVESFAINADITNQKVRLEYYIIRQNAAGGTLAARLAEPPGREIPHRLKEDVRLIADSLRITRPQ